MVWVATTSPVAPVTLANPQTPDPVYGYGRVEAAPAGAPVRARFTLSHVTYVGSHEGCGCGFNSGDLAWEGFERVDEVRPLIDAMSDEERAKFLAAQGSRERLRAIVEGALTAGPVEVFGCWAGDEVDAAVGCEDVAPAHFTERTEPIGERVLYRVSPR